MVVYEPYGTNPLGMDLTRAYSDQGVYIERDGDMYAEAIDPTDKGRRYTETNIPVEDDAEADDYEAALTEVGVEI